MEETSVLLEQIHAIDLDLIRKFRQICEKHQIRWCASSGTLLGAARHRGIIPWDDDVDLFVMWPDYQRLMELAPAECEYPYFFQGIYNEEFAMPNACRLRRSDTTGFTRWEQGNTPEDYNRGLFIDIFPLFYVPDSEGERAAQKELVLKLWKAIRGCEAMKLTRLHKRETNAYEQYIPSFLALCGERGIREPLLVDCSRLKQEYLLACAGTGKRCAEVGATSSKCHAPQLMWPSEWFDQMIELPFADTTIPCPAAYEKVLEKQYGDWRTPVRSGSLHEMAAVDPDRPWRDFKLSPPEP